MHQDNNDNDDSFIINQQNLESAIPQRKHDLMKIIIGISALASFFGGLLLFLLEDNHERYQTCYKTGYLVHIYVRYLCLLGIVEIIVFVYLNTANLVLQGERLTSQIEKQFAIQKIESTVQMIILVIIQVMAYQCDQSSQYLSFAIYFGIVIVLLIIMLTIK